MITFMRGGCEVTSHLFNPRKPYLCIIYYEMKFNKAFRLVSKNKYLEMVKMLRVNETKIFLTNSDIDLYNTGEPKYMIYEDEDLLLSPVIITCHHEDIKISYNDPFHEGTSGIDFTGMIYKDIIKDGMIPYMDIDTLIKYIDDIPSDYSSNNREFNIYLPYYPDHSFSQLKTFVNRTNNLKEFNSSEIELVTNDDSVRILTGRSVLIIYRGLTHIPYRLRKGNDKIIFKLPCLTESFKIISRFYD